jgi:hypothetical protein
MVLAVRMAAPALASAGEDEPVASGAIGGDRPGGGVAERRVDPNGNPRIGL